MVSQWLVNLRMPQPLLVPREEMLGARHCFDLALLTSRPRVCRIHSHCFFQALILGKASFGLTTISAPQRLPVRKTHKDTPVLFWSSALHTQQKIPFLGRNQ